MSDGFTWPGRCRATGIPTAFHTCGEEPGHAGPHVCVDGSEYVADDSGVEGAGEAVAVDVYDPSEHTVKEVLAHLETVDDDEYDRILRAEKAKKGKRRAGILNA